MRILFLTILFLSIVSTACDSGTHNRSVEIQSDNSKLQISTATPVLMRSIPITGLFLSVQIDDNEPTYPRANDAGEWKIELNLIPERKHDLTIKWFADSVFIDEISQIDFQLLGERGGVLLLEEFGQFVTPSTGATITPELDYLSAGRPEFDIDCDGYSNLEEVNNGTSLAIAEGLTKTACSDEVMPIELTEEERVWIYRLHDTDSADENSARITKIVQTMQVNSASFVGNLAYITNARTELFDADTNVSQTHAAWFSFRHRGNEPRFMEFAMYPSTGVLESDIDGQFCKDLMAEPAGLMCTLPYDWQEDRWYTLTIEETTPTTWRAQA